MNAATVSERYLQTLLQYYEEEITGEAEFYALADVFDEHDKLVLMARVERRAAQAIHPLLHKYHLTPRSESELKREGERWVQRNRTDDWRSFVAYIVTRYPGYLDDFAALREMAPEEDLPALEVLTAHEVAAIEFAERELAGDPDSVAPLRTYLADRTEAGSE